MIWLLAPLIIYFVLVLTVGLTRHRANKQIDLALSSNDKSRVLNIAWAWLEHDRVNALREHWGQHRFNDIDDYPDWSRRRMLLPHVVLATFLTIFYQRFLRRGDIFSSGPCPTIPNCSSYFIGLIHRYPFILAVAKTVIRIDGCHRGQPVSFDPDFHNHN